MIIQGVSLTGVTVVAPLFAVDAGLEVYYDPGNTSSYPGSGTTLYDLSPSGANATISGNPTRSDRYFNFTGSQSIITQNLAGLYSGWQHSLEVWVNPSAHCSAYSDLGTATANINYHTTGLEFYSVGPFTICNAMLWSSTSTTRVGGGSTPLNNWYQIVRVYNGSNTAYAYVNGVKSADTSIAWIPPSPGWYLGFGVSDTTRFTIGNAFQGKYGVIRLYNRVLSQSEVTQNYNATKGNYGL